LRVPPIRIPKRGIPSTWYFLVTLRCNLKCAHCSLREILNKYPGEAGLNHIRKAFDKIPLEGTAFILSGGEPFLRIDLAEIVKFLKEEKSVENVTIETNGIAATREMLESVISSGINYLYVSVDGFPDAYEKIRGRKEYFHKAINTVKTAIDLGAPYVYVITTINKFNVGSIDEFAAFLIKDVGVDGVRFLLVEELGGGKEIGESITDKVSFIKKIEYLHKKFGHHKIAYYLPPAVVPPRMRARISCNLGLYAIGILPDLRLTLCYRSVNLATKKTLLEADLNSLLQESFIKSMRTIYTTARYKGVCDLCAFKELCCGACRIAAYDILGSMDSPYPICQKLYEQGIFPEVFLAGFKIGK